MYFSWTKNSDEEQARSFPNIWFALSPSKHYASEQGRKVLVCDSGTSRVTRNRL